MRSPATVSIFIVPLLLSGAGCSDSSTEPALPATSATQEIQVDASAGFSYLVLGDTARVVTVTDPATSTAWDLGVFATNVSINGGAAGPGGVTAACLCRATEPTIAQLQAFSATSEKSRFDTVTATSLPSSLQFAGDSLQPALKGWYNGSAGATAAAKPTQSFIIVDGTAAPVYTKLRVTAIAAPTATSPGQITFEYATQPAAGAQPFGATLSRTVSVGTGPVYFDFKTGSETTAAANWTIQFRGWQIRVNGGASGIGSVSAVDASPFTLDQITLSFAQSIPPVAFSRDVFSGVFATKPWYRYNITGVDNQIWPTYDVYLIKRGTSIYKLQFVSYYNTQGQSRRITVRYARIAR